MSITPLHLLRQWLSSQKLDALIVPSNDPHFSEYVSPHYKCREWLTNFSGSAGTAIVTQERAALFTDSRYFLQAEEQLQGTGFELKKEGLPNTESLPEYIKKHLSSGKLAIDGRLYAMAQFESLSKELSPLQVEVIQDPFSRIWKDRENLPTAKAFLLSTEFTGKSCREKFQEVAQKLQSQGDIYIASSLDEVAWLCNLRGGDVAYTPVCIAYAALDFSTHQVHLFIDVNKLDAQDLQILKTEQVVLHEYTSIEIALPLLTANKKVIVNPTKTNVYIYHLLQKSENTQIVQEQSTFGVITECKAIKNNTEIAGVRKAMLADGVAWIKFWKWLEEHIDDGTITEISAGIQLRNFRALSPDFLDESFSPIVGYKSHGAIVHYSASPKSNIPLGRETFILIDTGAQYPYGTTDITRSLHFGKPTKQEKTDYTLVLKGHLQLSAAKFPYGTRGTQLDMLARQPMMQHHINYLHGTGHGIGHCLSVHEGPQSIRLQENPTWLEIGMINSCEPGIYRSGQYGIRIENLILTVKDGESDFGDFLAFEALTLCPFDLNAIDATLLTNAEIALINTYHSEVYAKLSPLLSTEEREFLKIKIKKLQ
ncbi:MAG: aminopeptidase P family protein [Bacteroidales bacterium]